MKIESWQLKQRQNLPLEVKIELTKRRIKDWYEHWDGNVYISFSGGKDSTVLLHLVRSLYPEVPAVFVDTGLEYPEIREFVKTIENVIWLKPKKSFSKVLKEHGYPVISKEIAHKLNILQNPTEKNKQSCNIYMTGNKLDGTKSTCKPMSKKWRYLIGAPFKVSAQCCNIMKKAPINVYIKETNRKPYIGVMAEESSLRTVNYLKRGCNSFNTKLPTSRPIAFWRNGDIWEYLKKFNTPYSEIYNKGYQRTGCMFCMFGCHLEKDDRFELMKKTHPKQYDYCMNKLGLKDILDYIKKGGK